MYSYSSVLVRLCLFFFFSSRRRHTRFDCDWSSDVCSSDLERAAVRGEPKATLPVEAVKIYAGVGDDLLCRAFRKVYAEGIGKFFDRFIKGSLDGGFDQAPLDLVAIGSSRQAQDGVQWIEAVLSPGTIFHARDGNGSKDGDQATRTEPLVAGEGLLRTDVWGGDPAHSHPRLPPGFGLGRKRTTEELPAPPGV